MASATLYVALAVFVISSILFNFTVAVKNEKKECNNELFKQVADRAMNPARMLKSAWTGQPREQNKYPKFGFRDEIEQNNKYVNSNNDLINIVSNSVADAVVKTFKTVTSPPPLDKKESDKTHGTLSAGDHFS